MNILVWIEQFQNSAAATSWEALSVAKKLGAGPVTAAVFGQGAEGLAQQAFQFGADAVLLADDATLADYRVEPYAALLTRLARDNDAGLILMGATTRGRDLAGSVAVDLGAGILSDVTDVSVSDSQVQVTRPVYAGKLLAKVVSTGSGPVIVTTRPRAFDRPTPNASATGTATAVQPALTEDQIATKVVEWITEAGEGPSLGDANIIVSGGRGVGGPDGFKPVRDLAKALGAAVGASRAAVDAGWIPYAHQVGQTGRTVSPDLYIACGISGAIQHQAGMRTAKTIVAINKDPEAPIFKLAHYGVVGDLFKILPPLAEEVQKQKG